jgi:polygalacturonase
VKNVVFRNVQMTMPIKGVYIKSNPGDTGDALVKNITYLNISMTHPIWWGIYIGP